MRAYYNENDPFAAAWLRNLIAEGLITDGEVDTRSICDVAPADLAGFSRVHFFAGIGGWDYALNRAGWGGERPVWTGSCPCQPFSAAGKRKGTADKRHLWPEMHRLIAECNPPTVFGEQVAAKDGRAWLAGVRTDLEALGYAVGAADICAAGIGAPHIRQRLYWGAERLADAANSGRELFARDAGIPRANTSELPEIEPWTGSGLSGLADAEHRSRRVDGKLAEEKGDRVREIPGQGARLRVAQPNSANGGLANAEHAERRAEREAEPEAYGRNGFRGSSNLSGMAYTDEGQRGRVADGEGREFDRQAPGRQQGDCLAEPSGDVSRLADSSGGLSGDGELQPCGQHGLKPEDGGTGVGVEHASGDGRIERRSEPGGRGANARRASGGLGHADDEGSQGRRLDAGEHADQRSPWAASLLIPCADGKFRRVPANEAGEPEPALFPLAYGVSNRVGTLRGAGNAIVPQVAAEFVKAFMQCCNIDVTLGERQ